MGIDATNHYIFNIVLVTRVQNQLAEWKLEACDNGMAIYLQKVPLKWYYPQTSIIIDASIFETKVKTSKISHDASLFA